MKKIFAAFVIVILAAGFTLSSCNKKPETIDYYEYFANFASGKGYVSAVEAVNLGEGVFVGSYDDSADIYITTEQLKLNNSDKAVSRYGFATDEGVIMSPRYSEVLDVRYNYAIVIKTIGSGTKIYDAIGVVCIRGEKVGKEYGFSYTYNSATTQYQFLNDDYLVMFGDKNYDGTAFDYATVYDFTSANGLLEVGRIANTTNNSIFSFYENYIVSIGRSVVRYYYFDKIDENGYFCLSEGGKYTPFVEADGYADLQNHVTVSVFYLGNSWFVETGIYSDTKEFTGYEQYEKKNNNPNYFVNRSTRFNIKSGKRFDTDRVTLVANKYSSDYIKSLTNVLNIDVNISEADNKPMYFQPIVPVSEFIKNGYSLVYYDFEYYDFQDKLVWGETFSIYDQKADIINLKDLIMPLLFVDGIGLQNSDPVYNIVGRDFAYNKSDGSTVTLKSVSSYLYDPVIINDGMVVGFRADFNAGPTMFTSMMGAASTDGLTEIPFEYVELTMFVDGYATGSKYVKESDTKQYREFYRIGKSGVVTKIQDVYCLKNGMYITKEGEKYGLFANDGKRLLEAQYTSISIIENYLVDGLYFTSHVVGIKDGCGVIIKLA